jgi:hypothetical protein
MVATCQAKENFMKTTQFGLLLGAIFGFALVSQGFGEMLIVMLIAAIGWVIASILAGDLDVSDLLDRSSRGGSSRIPK